jgi:hypothetical protein
MLVSFPRDNAIENDSALACHMGKGMARGISSSRDYSRDYSGENAWFFTGRDIGFS